MRERCFRKKWKCTEGVALSGIEDFIRTDLWRDRFWRRRGKGYMAVISQAKGQS